MSNFFKKTPLLLLCCAVSLTACKSSDKNPPAPAPAPAPTNQAPSANAGADQAVNSGSMVNVVGSGTDSDGSIASYSWSQASGTPISIVNANAASANFTAPALSTADTVVLTLTVTDNQGATATDTVSITLRALPTVSAGNDINATERQIISLKATASGNDGANISSYTWVQESGDTVTLIDSDKATAKLDVPLLKADKSYVFKVTATDSYGAQASDTVTVSAKNIPFLLNDTGITKCGNYVETGSAWSNDIDCALTIDGNGHAVPPGQDGHHGFDVSHNDASDGSAGFSFTKLDANGADLPASASAWACVRDNVTGLIWEVKTDANKSITYIWDVTGTHITMINTTGLCGANDWRLPSVVELQSLVDYSKAAGPMIDSNYFNHTLSADYWTVSPYANYSSYAWVVSFSDGRVYGYLKNYPNSFRLVREDSH